MARRKLIAGNWKMNKLRGEGADIVGGLLPLVQSAATVDVAVCPPFTALEVVGERLRGSRVGLGAQNLYSAEKAGAPVMEGAYTGEVSASMLKDAGVKWVILGHSERRQYFGETDAGVNLKSRACYAVGLLPIICVGETLAEREANQTAAVVDRQMRGCLAGLAADRVRESVIAYEPVWAIGTGRTATPEQAQEVHLQIRTLINELFGEGVAGAMRILYGGSMNEKNAKELLSKPDIDGGLIGGASLKADQFALIVEAAK